jgi:hypothetical protein
MIVTSNELDHFISAHSLHIAYTILSLESFGYASLVFVQIKLHLNHVGLHPLLLVFVALLKLLKFVDFEAVILLVLFAIQVSPFNTLIHNTNPKLSSRLCLCILLYFGSLLSASY